MNKLFDVLTGDAALPDHLVIGGVRYPILTDFRHWARVESTLLDASLGDADKAAYFLSSFLPSIHAGLIDLTKGYPFPLEEGLLELRRFYALGQEEKKERGPGGSGQMVRRYDFKHDAGMIYAAFRSAYGMDLANVPTLHWWVFRAMFYGLPETAAIRGLMEARGQRIDKPTKAQKDAMAAVALPERLRYFRAGRRSGRLNAWVAEKQAEKARKKQADGSR